MDLNSQPALIELCQEIKIRYSEGALRRDEDLLTNWQRFHAKQYRVSLTYKRRVLTVDYFLDPRDLPATPTAYAVMVRLVHDAQQGTLSFENYCTQYGYPKHDKKYSRIWQSFVTLRSKLRKFLRDDFETFLLAK